ncbi:uncharacterized protein LOC134776572 [Penaeus indicus]|uniref:uncharacterized protein LOC134776572 n=1 Tax=Penaeus indicus TaxID=29960 RepID=UPI00300D8862
MLLLSGIMVTMAMTGLNQATFEDTRNISRFHRKKCWKLLCTDDLQPRSFFTSPVENNGQKTSGNMTDTQIENHKNSEKSEEERNCMSQLHEVKQTEEDEAYSNDNSLHCQDEKEKSIKTVLDLSSRRRERETVSDEDDEALHDGMKLMPEEAMFLSYALGCLVVSQSVPAKVLPIFIRGK